MNIVQINHYGGPERYCPAYRPNYLAREWTKLGHDVTIIGATNSHLFHSVPNHTKAYTVEQENGIRYVLLNAPAYHGNGARRVANMFVFLARLLRYESRLARELLPDVVVAGSAYVLDCVPASRLARRCGAGMVREVRDLWPLTLTELGGMSPRHPLVRLIQWAEDFSYRRADRIVTTLPCSGEHMRAHGLDPDRWAFIAQGADVASWRSTVPLPTAYSEVLSRLRRDGHFVVGYAGSHGLANSLGPLVDAASLLRDSSIAFVLVGQGPDKDLLKRKAQEAGLKSVTFLPIVPKAAMPALLQEFDAAYIGWLRHPIYRFGISPNKLMDYMMAGKPIIHAVDAANDVVAEAGCGLCIPPEDPAALADAIARLVAMTPSDREEMGELGRVYVHANYDYRIIAKRYLDILRETM